MSLVEAHHVSKRFLLRHGHGLELKVRFLNRLHGRQRTSVEEFWALKDISLGIARGEAVGLIGRNGSGKSTLLKLIAGIHQPTSGRLLLTQGARICSMIELGIGFHPELTGRENISLNAAIHGLTRQEIEAISGAIVDYSDLHAFMDVPIKTYSSGMHMRLGFAIAANLNPTVLLLDEIFAVGDAPFQERCLATLRRFVDEGRTIVFVSHAPQAIRTMTRRLCVLDRGTLAFDGAVEQGLSFYDRMLQTKTEHHVTAAPVDERIQERADGVETDHGSKNAWIARETASWTAEIVRTHGLRHGHRLLDLSGPSIDLREYLMPIVGEGRYCRVHVSAAAPNAPGVSLAPDLPKFDVAVAADLLPMLPFNEVARCMAMAVRGLTAAGRLYVTWFENPDAGNFDPIVHPNGTTTYSDRPPYHYPLVLLACVCDAVGARVERVEGATSPAGETLLAISRVGDRAD